MGRYRTMRWIAAGLLVSSGCGSQGPRSFSARNLNDVSPINRARSATMGDGLPATVVVPALIERLGDPDPVVRMTADEELKRRTGRDFGFQAWDDDTQRGLAVARWHQWWAATESQIAQSSTKPAANRA